ncbi:MAG: histidine phosphatase family protein [Patescibacteria group bacterium]|nr:histidine phosphatase family protein [Patescibacteria group bacterium]
MITNIYLVRHTEVENPLNIVYSRLPGFPLSKKGREEAKRLAEYFSTVKLDAIYSSPLLRTKETAEIIAWPHNLKIKYSDQITEWEFGIWSGVKKETRDPEMVEIFNEKVTKFTIKGAETVLEIQKRVLDFLYLILKEQSGQNILVVSHGGPLSILLNTLLKKDFDPVNSYLVNLGSVTKLSFEGQKFISSEYNDIIKVKEKL